MIVENHIILVPGTGTILKIKEEDGGIRDYLAISQLLEINTNRISAIPLFLKDEISFIDNEIIMRIDMSIFDGALNYMYAGLLPKIINFDNIVESLTINIEPYEKIISELINHTQVVSDITRPTEIIKSEFMFKKNFRVIKNINKEAKYLCFSLMEYIVDCSLTNSHEYASIEDYIGHNSVLSLETVRGTSLLFSVYDKISIDQKCIYIEPELFCNIYNRYLYHFNILELCKIPQYRLIMELDRLGIIKNNNNILPSSGDTSKKTYTYPYPITGVNVGSEYIIIYIDKLIDIVNTIDSPKSLVEDFIKSLLVIRQQ